MAKEPPCPRLHRCDLDIIWTIETRDEVILQCLRAISDYAQVLGNKRIVWGGGKKDAEFLSKQAKEQFPNWRLRKRG